MFIPEAFNKFLFINKNENVITITFYKKKTD